MSPNAELSSVATALEDLVRRITGIAESLVGPEEDSLTNELYEVERNLSAAQRRLSRLVDSRAG